MKKIILSLLLISCYSFIYAEENTLRAGVAMGDISPPVGVPLAGYGGGKRRLDFPDLDPDNYHTLLVPSEGILDPLITKVLVLESNGVKIAIIKLDSIGVMDQMVQDLAKKIASTGITYENLVVTGTHTHSGPGAMTTSFFWSVAAVDVFEERIYNPFLDKLAQMVIEANNNLQPASLGIGTTTSFELSRNRRNHPGVFDPVIGVFKVNKADGTPMAILYNFAIHGTCYGDDNLKMSGDVMGYSERWVEKTMQENQTPVVAMFINSTEGDVAPKRGGDEGAKSVGEGLGRKVMEVVPNIATERAISISVTNQEISFPKAHLNLDLDNGARDNHEIDCWGVCNWINRTIPNKGEIFKLEITDLVPMSFRLQALRIGDTMIACIPGEALTNIGKVIKETGSKLGFRNTFIFGLANGHMGYIADEFNFDEGGYEAMLTIYGRDQGKKITDVFANLFGKLATNK